MENGQQEFQPGIQLGRTWRKFPEDFSQRDILQKPYGNHQRLEYYQEVQTPGGEGQPDKGESSHYPNYIRTADPDRAYSDSFRLTRRWPNQLSSGFKPFRNQQISGQESPFFTITGIFKEKTRIKWQKKYHLQPEEERVTPNDPEAVGFGERSAQEPEVVVNNSRISSPINRNITPTHIEHNVFTPESNLNSDALWLQMSQYAVKTQKKFAELEASHERMKILTASMDKTVKTLQEGHAQLSKASEETNKRMNLVFEEQHHSKRDRDCLDQDIKKPFNAFHNMKPITQGHVRDNQYHQYEIEPDAMLMNKASSQSKYHDGDNMSYSQKEGLKQLPEASSWLKFSGTGEYDCMELIDYIDGLFIDFPSIPDYLITARLNTEFKGNTSIWYTEMKEIHGRRNWTWWKSQINKKYRDGTWIWKTNMSFENDKYSVDKDLYEWCLRQSKRLKSIGPQMNIWMRNHKLLTQMQGELDHAVKCRCNQNCNLDDIANTLQDFKDKPRERVAEVTKKKNSCHNCGSTDHYANNCPKAKKKVYAIEKFSEEESPTEDPESDSMGDGIREQSDEKQDPREEFLVEYQEETTLEIQYIQLEAGIPQDTANRNLCKHTQDAQKLLVTPAKGMAYIHGTSTKMTVCIDNSQHPLIIDRGHTAP
ncbi:hypothetical protein O181_073725 [Austropuccinia psidii MF-1]|uniref:CCHC-type domain-containing protein n=1 Tax=Austropuccinia psidii MF-1 TaxID=1389203 RepID=A0A9Q3ICB5_9BASI|nr:hypothetical protein [Austropuccinia psidii MF-1]